jgi:ABC-type transporter Mla subunit MlaD
MDQQLLLEIMAVFVAVSAIALLLQLGMLFGIYKSSKAMRENITRLMPKIEAITTTSLATVEDSRKKIADITTKTNDILDVTKRQLAKIEELLDDAATRARTQMDRAEMVVDDAMSRAQETVATVHSGIMKPIREINGVAMGVKAALNYFVRAGRPSPDQVTADEEMFI